MTTEMIERLNSYCTKNRSSHQRYPIKKAVFKNFAIFTGKHLYWSLFLKIDSNIETFIKENSSTCVFWKNYETFKNTNFEEHLRTAASGKKLHELPRASKKSELFNCCWRFSKLKTISINGKKIQFNIPFPNVYTESATRNRCS